ncbi:hypothetical protein K7X08_020983 [Anisodus acutangulus]|uniref:Uncharacterized protein n=1 Tax=Anisodus acutangulus TaxID=402998 RepID=A0A9Q1RRP3_9SOLA|nr:hypothetical protein K7X08_020983 [Anisodus acutangulus]
MERIAYARVLVKTKVSQPLLDSIDIVTLSGAIHKQCIEYDWKPRYCTCCMRFGQCRNKPEDPERAEEFQEASRRRRRNKSRRRPWMPKDLEVQGGQNVHDPDAADPNIVQPVPATTDVVSLPSEVINKQVDEGSTSQTQREENEVHAEVLTTNSFDGLQRQTKCTIPGHVEDPVISPNPP